jgi:hypothetical protein
VLVAPLEMETEMEMALEKVLVLELVRVKASRSV